MNLCYHRSYNANFCFSYLTALSLFFFCSLVCAANDYEGKYSTCVAISDNIYGAYKARHESVPCADGTNFFKAKDGHWYSCYFGNDNQSPWRKKPGIVRVDFDAGGKIVVAKNQLDFILTKTP